MLAFSSSGEPLATTRPRSTIATSSASASGDVQAVDLRAAARGSQERREHSHCRRLSRAVWSEEAEDTPRVDGQVNSIDGFNVRREVLGQLVGEYGGHVVRKGMSERQSVASDETSST